MSVGINTEPRVFSAEEDSSETLTIIGRDVSCDTEMFDLTPSDPDPFQIMEEETRGHNGDISEHKDDLDHSDSEVTPGEECRVEVQEGGAGCRAGERVEPRRGRGDAAARKPCERME